MSQDDTHELAAPQAGKVAPESVALRAQPRPVTRLNRRTLAVLVGGLSVSVLGALMWSLRPQRRSASEPAELYNVDRVSRSEGLDRLPADYSKLPPQVPELGPPLPGDLGPAIVKSQQPVVPTYTPPGQDPGAAERDARRKESEAAAGSSVFFRSGSQRAAAAPTQLATASAAPGLSGFDPMAAGPASTAAQPADPTTVQEPAGPERGVPESRKHGNPQLRESENAGFAVSGDGRNRDRWCAGHGHQVRSAGRRDRHGDGTDLRHGQRQVSADPARLAHSRPLQQPGELRAEPGVQVVWNRIILPDTSSLTLDNLAGTDPAGYAGLEDGVDWHWDRIFAGAALTTLLGIGAELAAPESRQNGDRVIIAGRDSLQDSVNQVGQEMTRHNLNIQPTLTERPGLPVRIIVNRDLVLRPYQPLFFNRGTSR